MLVGVGMGFDLIRYRRARFARQVLTSALFTGLVFVLVIMNLSFALTLHEARDKLDQGFGPIIITRDEIRFAEPLDNLVWNATQAWLDNSALSLTQKIGDAFLIITLVVMGMTFWHETSKGYAEAKRDNEEYGGIMGTMYALGARPGSIYTAFLLEKALAYGAGFLVGLAVSHFALLPFLMDGGSLLVVDWVGIRNTIAALFFRKFDYVVAATTAMTFVMWIMVVKSIVLTRGLRCEILTEATRESAY